MSGMLLIFVLTVGCVLAVPLVKKDLADEENKRMDPANFHMGFGKRMDPGNFHMGFGMFYIGYPACEHAGDFVSF